MAVASLSTSGDTVPVSVVTRVSGDTASLSIIIPCVIAAVVLVAAVLFLIRKRTVAKTQHHRASMPAVTDEKVVDAEA